MLRHSIKLYLRSFFTHGWINGMNLFGLSIGLAACMLIALFLFHEHRYDADLTESDRIYRVNMEFSVGGGQALRLPTLSFPVVPGLAEEIGAIESWTRMHARRTERPVKVEGKTYQESYVTWVDSAFFEVFGLRMLEGDRSTALRGDESVVLTASTAYKYFGDRNAVGRSLEMADGKSYQITGVVEDLPQPTHLPIAPMYFSTASMARQPVHWIGEPNYAGYIKVKPGHTLASVGPVVEEVYEKNAREVMDLVGAEFRIWLEPLRDIHFSTDFDFGMGFAPTVSRRTVLMFVVIGLFILVMACLSYVNLFTARSHDRMKQVGLFKAIGATRARLFRHFVGESVLTMFIAALAGFGLAWLLLPVFEELVGRTTLETVSLLDPILLGSLVVFVLGVGTLAGLYPAMFLSSFTPVQAIRNEFFPGAKRSRFRSFLIVFQFTVTVVLALSALTVMRQLHYMQSLDLGYQPDQILTVRTGPGMTRDDCRAIWETIKSEPGVLGRTFSSHLPTAGYMEYTYDVPNHPDLENLMTRQLTVDPYFIETLGLDLVAGRNFHEEIERDAGRSVILNETAVRRLGWEDDAVGRLLDANPASGEDNYMPLEIVGVVRDFRYESLRSELHPMLLTLGQGDPHRFTLKVDPVHAEAIVNRLETVWKKVVPEVPYRYSFLDETFDRMYHTDIRLGKLFSFFTALALVIALMGLLALIAFATEKRIREIGIRKVLGATTGELVRMFTARFVLLVVVANVLAWPIAVYAMRRWLEGFTERAGLEWWIYPSMMLVTLLLAFGVTGRQILITCRRNPVHALRVE
ncbi:FtsX-like permease family protein [bacterium]|nr:FtsX-like permease family protein [bacterium]